MICVVVGSRPLLELSVRLLTEFDMMHEMCSRSEMFPKRQSRQSDPTSEPQPDLHVRPSFHGNNVPVNARSSWLTLLHNCHLFRPGTIPRTFLPELSKRSATSTDPARKMAALKHEIPKKPKIDVS